MKKKPLTLLSLALAGSLLAGAGTAPAQERTPAPKDKTAPAQALPGDDMPMLRTHVTPVPMPTPDMQGGMVEKETGRIIIYNDSRTGLGFNFDEQTITDYKTGKVYKFSEHPAYKEPKKELRKRI